MVSLIIRDMLSVREIRESDIDLIINYWLTAEPAFLKGMGVDIDKIPTKEKWVDILSEQLNQPYETKKSYCIIWQLDNKPIGHNNVNNIEFGKEAYMHLHMWNNNVRQKGMGAELVKMALPYYFKNLQLKRLFCEPYALNPAPNKTLEKIGFKFIKEYVTTPGYLNLKQPVNRWELSYEDYKRLTD